jgi:hypothetical protein
VNDVFGRYASEEDLAVLRRGQLTSIRERMKLHKRIERLEQELAWVNVVASTLAGVCIDKGLLTPDELKERVAKLEAERAAAAAAAAAAAPPRSSRRKRFKPRT